MAERIWFSGLVAIALVGCVEGAELDDPPDGSTGDVDDDVDVDSDEDDSTGDASSSESGSAVPEPDELSPIVWEHALAQPLALGTGADGSVYVAASVEDSDGDPRILSVRALEPDGTLRWEEKTVAVTDIEAAAVEVEGDRVGVIVGLDWDLFEDLDGTQQAWVLSTDDGTGVWGTTILSRFPVDRVGIDLTDRDIALVGSAPYAISETGTSSGFLVAVFRDDDSTPAVQWVHGEPGHSSAGAHDVSFLPDGGVVATGNVDNRPYVARLDAAGERVWDGKVDFASNHSVTVSVHDDELYLHSNGDVVVTDFDGNAQRTFALSRTRTSYGRLRWRDDEFVVGGRFNEGVGVAVFDANGKRSWFVAEPEELPFLPLFEGAWSVDGDVVLLSSWPDPVVARVTQR